MSAQDDGWEDLDRCKTSPSGHKRRHRKHGSRSTSRERSSRKETKDSRIDGSRHKERSDRGTSEREHRTSRGEMSRGFGDFDTQVGAPGFTQFPGQYDQPAIGPQAPHHDELSSHVKDQFPGQDPVQYARPAFRRGRTIEEGGYGLAADYYNDEGQSVATQPGRRPPTPDIIVGTQPHLMTPSTTAKPPAETGHGSAAEFYADSVASGNTERMLRISRPSGSTSGRPSKASMPNKPSKSDKPGNTSNSTSTARPVVEPSAGLELNTYVQPSGQGEAASYYDSNVLLSSNAPAPPQMHTTSAPAVPTANYYGPPQATNALPGRLPAHSNLPTYVAGAAGLSVGAFALHEHHDHQQQNGAQQSPSSLHVADGYEDPSSYYGGAFPAPGMNGSTGMDFRHKHHGPVDTLLDILQDREDVRKMEEYTEYIGVCRHCFDPRSSPAQAPRPHSYARRRSSESLRRRSNESLRKSSRVDKDSRYYSSDNGKRRKGTSWLGAGLAGYGLAKVGGALWKNQHDFDDTYSIKSGRRESSLRHSTRTAVRNSNRADNEVVRREDKRESTFVKLSDGSIVKQRSRSHRSRSRSRNRRAEISDVATGTVLGAAFAGSSYSAARSRRDKSPSGFARRMDNSSDRSPRGAFVRRRRSSRSRSHSPGLGEILGLTSSARSRRRGEHSPNGSYVDISRSSKSQSSGGMGGFFSSRPEKQRRGKEKRGFFSFGNYSSSSSGSDLAFGTGFARERSSNKRASRKSSSEHLDATLLGIGATAAALAAAQSMSGRRRPEVVAVRERKDRKERKIAHGRGLVHSHSSIPDEDGWESASEDDDHSSVSSGLAFGDFDIKGKSPASHPSIESLTSQSSGTGKWGWRWGSKKKKRKDSPPVSQYPPQASHVPVSDGAGVMGVGASTGSLPYMHESGRTSHNSMQPMQYITPEPLSDSRTSLGGPSSQSPLMTNRPGPIPIQQPRPVAPVQSSLYATQAEAQPLTYQSTSPSVFAQPRPDQDAPRRTQSSPVSSHFVRNAAIAGAAVAATAGILSSNKTKTSKEDSPSNVRFDLTDKQIRKEQREQQRRQEVREEDERQGLERQMAAERDARYAAEIQQKERDAAYRREREQQIAADNNYHAASARREAEQQARLNRQEQQSRLERGAVTYSDSQSYDQTTRRETDQAPATVNTSAPAPESPMSQREHEIGLQIEQKRRELDAREQGKREQDAASSEAWRASVAAGVAGATVGAIIAGPKHHDGLEHGNQVQYEAQTMEPSSVHSGQPLIDDDIFDPDFFKRERSKSDFDRHAEAARQEAAKVVDDLEDRYKHPAPSQAEFFAPKELSEPASGKTAVADPIGDNDVHVFNVSEVDFEHAAGDTTYIGTSGPGIARKPWGIPTLNVIAPTPPTSYAGSARGDKSPVSSPIVGPRNHPEEARKGADKSATSRVTWSEDNTRTYETQSPDSNPDLPANKPASQDEIVVEADLPGEGTRRTTYGPETFSHRAASNPQTRDFATDDIQDQSSVSEAQMFYQSPFYETVSDLGFHMDSPGTEGAPPVRGFVEGEIEEFTPVEEKAPYIPGEFNEDDQDVMTERQEADQELEVPSSKKKGKKDKSRKKSPLEETTFADETAVEQLTKEQSPEWEPPLSKKDKKKRDKALRRSMTEDDFSATTPAVDAPEKEFRAFEARIEPEPKSDYFPSIKDKKKDKPAQRSVDFDNSPAVVPARDEPSFAEISSSSKVDTETQEDDYFSSEKDRKKREKAAKLALTNDDPPKPIIAREDQPEPIEDTKSLPEEEDMFLSKKDRKKREKAAKRSSGIEFPAAESFVPEPETERDASFFDTPFSKKELKKREKEARRLTFDEETAGSSDRPFESPAAQDDADDFGLLLSAKEKKKRAKEAKKKDKSDMTAEALAGGAAAVGTAGLSKSSEVETPEREPRQSGAWGEESIQSTPFQDAQEEVDTPGYNDRGRYATDYMGAGSVAPTQDETQNERDIGLVGDTERRPRREKKHRSSEDFDETASTVSGRSSRSQRDSREDSSRKDKKSGILGFFSRKSGSSPSSTENGDDRVSANKPDGSQRRRHRHRDEEDDLDDTSRRSGKNLDSNAAESGDRDLQEQSFLERRSEVEELPPLPASSPSSPTLAPETVPHKESNASNAGGAASLPSLAESRKLQALVAAHPADLPALPESPIASPTHYETPRRPSLGPIRPSSSTAVPLRFRRPPSSPGVNSPGFERDRSASFSTPVAVPSPMSPVTMTNPRSRQSRPNSMEFRHSTEYRPLYLVERNRKAQELQEEEQLPSLPSSKQTSRASSAQGSEGYESAAEFVTPAEYGETDGPILERGFEPEHGHDVLSSGQTTPRAGHFPRDMFGSPHRAQPEYYSWDDMEREERLRQEADLVDQSAVQEPLRAELLPALPSSRPTSPTRLDENERSHLDSAMEEAGSAMVGGTAAAAAVSSETPHSHLDKSTDSDEPEVIAVMEHERDTVLSSRADPVRPGLSRSSSSKKGKKGKKSKEGKLGYSTISDLVTPLEVTPEELQLRREQDAQDAVDSWFDPVPSTSKTKKGKKGKKMQAFDPWEEPEREGAAVEGPSASTTQDLASNEEHTGDAERSLEEPMNVADLDQAQQEAGPDEAFGAPVKDQKTRPMDRFAATDASHDDANTNEMRRQSSEIEAASQSTDGKPRKSGLAAKVQKDTTDAGLPEESSRDTPLTTEPQPEFTTKKSKKDKKKKQKFEAWADEPAQPIVQLEDMVIEPAVEPEYVAPVPKGKKGKKSRKMDLWAHEPSVSSAKPQGGDTVDMEKSTSDETIQSIDRVVDAGQERISSQEEIEASSPRPEEIPLPQVEDEDLVERQTVGSESVAPATQTYGGDGTDAVTLETTAHQNGVRKREDTVDKHSIEKYSVAEPIVGEPTAGEPTAEEPAVEEPTAEEPTVEEPTAKERTQMKHQDAKEQVDADDSWFSWLPGKKKKGKKGKKAAVEEPSATTPERAQSESATTADIEKIREDEVRATASRQPEAIDAATISPVAEDQDGPTMKTAMLEESEQANEKTPVQQQRQDLAEPAADDFWSMPSSKKNKKGKKNKKSSAAESAALEDEQQPATPTESDSPPSTQTTPLEMPVEETDVVGPASAVEEAREIQEPILDPAMESERPLQESENIEASETMANVQTELIEDDTWATFPSKKDKKKKKGKLVAEAPIPESKSQNDDRDETSGTGEASKSGTRSEIEPSFNNHTALSNAAVPHTREMSNYAAEEAGASQLSEQPQPSEPRAFGDWGIDPLLDSNVETADDMWARMTSKKKKGKKGKKSVTAGTSDATAERNDQTTCGDPPAVAEREIPPSRLETDRQPQLESMRTSGEPNEETTSREADPPTRTTADFHMPGDLEAEEPFIGVSEAPSRFPNSLKEESVPLLDTGDSENSYEPQPSAATFEATPSTPGRDDSARNVHERPLVREDVLQAYVPREEALVPVVEESPRTSIERMEPERAESKSRDDAVPIRSWADKMEEVDSKSAPEEIRPTPVLEADGEQDDTPAFTLKPSRKDKKKAKKARNQGVESPAREVEETSPIKPETFVDDTMASTREASLLQGAAGKLAVLHVDQYGAAQQDKLQDVEPDRAADPAAPQNDDFFTSAKLSKKDKKKNKKTKAWDESSWEAESAQVVEPTVEERSVPPPEEAEVSRPAVYDAVAGAVEPQDYFEMPKKQTKKEKRKAKKKEAVFLDDDGEKTPDVELGLEVDAPVEQSGDLITESVYEDRPQLAHLDTAEVNMLESGMMPQAVTQQAEPYAGARNAATYGMEQEDVSRSRPESRSGTSVEQSRQADPDAETSRALSPETHDLDFAATLAAGLANSGFDPDLVVNDQTFHRRASPPGTMAEVDPEEVFASTTKKSKKSKKRDEELLPTATNPEEFGTGATTFEGAHTAFAEAALAGPKNAEEDTTGFAAALAAGLGAAGFAANVFDRPGLEGHARADEPEEFTFTQSKKKKGKKGKRADPEVKADDILETRAIDQANGNEMERAPEEDMKTVKDKTGDEEAEAGPEALGETAREVDSVCREAEPTAEDEWALPMKKKGKKGKKKAAILAWDAEPNASEPTPIGDWTPLDELPTGETAAPATEQSSQPVQAEQGQIVAAAAAPEIAPVSKKKGKKSKKDKAFDWAFDDAAGRQEPAPGIEPAIGPSEAPRDVEVTSSMDNKEEFAINDKPIAGQQSVPRPAEPISVKSPISPSVASIFPGLERIKRRTTSSASQDIAAPHDERASLASPLRSGFYHTSEVSQSLPAVVDDRVKDQDRSLPEDEALSAGQNADGDVQEKPAWLFDNLRDSGVPSMDSPGAHEAYNVRGPVRDSGYDDANESLRSNRNSTEKHGQPARASQYVSDQENRESQSQASDAQPVVDAAAWTLPVKKARGGEQSTRDKEEFSSPVESTTKNRTSYLFQSPPNNGQPESGRSNKSFEKEGVQHDADYFDDHGSTSNVTSVAMSPISPSGSQLPYIPMESPVRKKTRPISDVGMPEPGVKAARRTETPQQSFRERMTSSGKLPPPIETTVPLPGRDRAARDAAPRDGSELGSTRRAFNDLRSPSTQNHVSTGSVQRFRTPDQLYSGSVTSNRSSTPTLRRTDRSMSGDLRAASRQERGGEARRISPATTTSGFYDPPLTPPLNEDERAAAAANMANIYEGWPDGQSSAPSMHAIELQARMNELIAENQRLQHGRGLTSSDGDMHGNELREALDASEAQLREKDAQIYQIRAMLEPLQQEIARLNETNGNLSEANRNLIDDTNDRYATLQEEHAHAHEQWQQSSRELQGLRDQHGQLTNGMEDIVRQHIDDALEDKNTEIRRLREELDVATEQIRALQLQIQSSTSADFLTVRDEDYFDAACQKLCQYVQGWVLRFSKTSDNRACRLSTELTDEKVEARLDNAILDGSDVDKLLGDRIRRRDVFMSVVMMMVYEYIFTRYLFGMDREQRQKLKALEKILLEVGPQRAVAQWRATTLTLLSRRPAFATQCSLDTEAVTQEIYGVLASLLPPPAYAEAKLLASLKTVLVFAIDLSIEFKSQRAEYLMISPPQPDYDTNGDLKFKINFNAATMNERSGEYNSNDELQATQATVKMFLFPLVIKRGDDVGDGEDETVICPAQVLVAGGKGKKVVRMMSGAMDIDEPRRSRQSLLSMGTDSNMI